jgi:hypothetical protein
LLGFELELELELEELAAAEEDAAAAGAAGADTAAEDDEDDKEEEEEEEDDEAEAPNISWSCCTSESSSIMACSRVATDEGVRRWTRDLAPTQTAKA